MKKTKKTKIQPDDEDECAFLLEELLGVEERGLPQDLRQEARDGAPPWAAERSLGFANRWNSRRNPSGQPKDSTSRAGEAVTLRLH